MFSKHLKYCTHRVINSTYFNISFFNNFFYNTNQRERRVVQVHQVVLSNTAVRNSYSATQSFKS